MALMQTIEPQPDEARRARILEGATSVFLAYGFQRTTMEDIARAAEISRPALYLHFRNKTDIYRALAADFLGRFLAAAKHALAGEGSLLTRVERAVSCTLDTVLEIETSPHGAEILDMKGSLAADIVADGRARMHALFEAAISAEAQRSRASGVEPDLLAALILDALDGMRLRNLPVDEQRRTAAAYVGAVLGRVCA
jgi:AcrR family transcriptional regulator